MPKLHLNSLPGCSLTDFAKMRASSAALKEHGECQDLLREDVDALGYEKPEACSTGCSGAGVWMDRSAGAQLTCTKI